jgi:four helix bundle protein
VETQIQIAQRLYYISQQQAQKILSLLKEISKMLAGLKNKLTPGP